MVRLRKNRHSVGRRTRGAKRKRQGYGRRNPELLIGVSLPNRISANITQKRLKHHAIHPEVAWIAELLDADRHRFVSGSGLRSVGAKKSVPPRQVESKIAVGLTHQDRMVDAVHVRRHNEPAQNAVYFARDTNVRVIEYRCSVEQHFECQNRERRRAHGSDHSELDKHRQQNLDRMKAQPRTNIEFEIGVMHPMQAPEARNGMKEHVLQIDREVEDNH